ncbi:cobalamin biosynthesis protein [Rhizohabitans arisaemae]|uniref:cobalamin biosynthesis protein n=1 Tax=Rhizohabitans arisaemae TaxID=2720610 RepID=UPI0024B13C1A|nr:cobalamin biosynthesis protein [Rhizohabitans arisaemae]
MPTWRRSHSRALGLALGFALDKIFADPRRGHPVAAFGRAAGFLEKRLYGDSRVRGSVFAALSVGAVAGAGIALERVTRSGRGSAFTQTAATAAATWAVLGGTSLAREGERMARTLSDGDLTAARGRLGHLCGRDPSRLDSAGIARAALESVAENTSDAVVAPLFWGACLGVPGLLAYRAINTLDAMVGHRSPRYQRFGWASARLDDLANHLPARITGLLGAVAAPIVGGSPRRALSTMLRYGYRHPSPNSGVCEAAFAGALGVRLGGLNHYAGRDEFRPHLGEGAPPTPQDLRNGVRLARTVNLLALATAAAITLRPSRERQQTG